jgi:hypothetical protein
LFIGDSENVPRQDGSDASSAFCDDRDNASAQIILKRRCRLVGNTAYPPIGGWPANASRISRRKTALPQPTRKRRCDDEACGHRERTPYREELDHGDDQHDASLRAKPGLANNLIFISRIRLISALIVQVPIARETCVLGT